MDMAPPPKRARQDSSNAVTKGCTMTPKEATCDVKETTQKTNQIKYHEANISCLYLIS
jgi:hypothetical protein